MRRFTSLLAALLLGCLVTSPSFAADLQARTVRNVWGELYIQGKSQLNGIKGIVRKKVAVMKGDFNGATFRNTAEKFGITCDRCRY